MPKAAGISKRAETAQLLPPSPPLRSRTEIETGTASAPKLFSLGRQYNIQACFILLTYSYTIYIYTKRVCRMLTTTQIRWLSPTFSFVYVYIYIGSSVHLRSWRGCNFTDLRISIPNFCIRRICI